MEPDDLDLHFYPIAALPDGEREEWHRIVLQALPDAIGCLTVVFVHHPSGWVLEGFLWAAPAGGFFPLANGRFHPLRTRVITALTLAGKRVRTP
jgi:hypothetical protein